MKLLSVRLKNQTSTIVAVTTFKMHINIVKMLNNLMILHKNYGLSGHLNQSKMLLKYREKILKKSNHSLKNLEEKLIFNAKKHIIFDVCSGKKTTL